MVISARDIVSSHKIWCISHSRGFDPSDCFVSIVGKLYYSKIPTNMKFVVHVIVSAGTCLAD